MPPVLSVWRRLPVLVRAPLAGLAVASAGTIPWSLLAQGNGRWVVTVPWAIVPMAIYLRLLWRYLRGEGWPGATSEARRASLRANPLSADLWGASMLAGLLGFAALMPLVVVLGRVVRLPAEAQPINAPDAMPFATVLVLLVMASIVAGVVEEAAFRGYMQGPIERRHGALVALVLSGSVFGALHFTHHPAGVLTMLPYYMVVTLIYGGLAWATGSIMPGIVLHTLGDIFSLTRLWTTGRPEWQQAPAHAPLIWESGPNGAFWGALAILFLLGSAAIWSYTSLAAAARSPTARSFAERSEPVP